MPKQSIITTPIKESIVRARGNGRHPSDIALDFQVSRAAVSNILKKSRDGNSLKRKPKSGRPRKTTDRQERMLVKVIKHDPTKTATDLQHHANNVMGRLEPICMRFEKKIFLKNLTKIRYPNHISS